MTPTKHPAETPARPSVTLRPPTARRSIVGGQGCGVLVRDGPTREGQREIRLQRP
jgi:hypothetical protein